jgi:hypothetical protein
MGTYLTSKFISAHYLILELGKIWLCNVRVIFDPASFTIPLGPHITT